MTYDPHMMDRIPKWLEKQIGKNGVEIDSIAPWRPIIVRVRDTNKYLVWGSLRKDGKCAELQQEGYELKRELDDARRKERARQDAARGEVQLTLEEKWLLRAEHIDQPKTGTGHKPGEVGGWLGDEAPTELVTYLKRAIELGRNVIVHLRWPIRFDSTIRKIAEKYHCEIPAHINFIKKESRLKAWGPSGYVIFDNPPDTPNGVLIKGIIAENLFDDQGRPLKVVEKNGRTTIIDVHLVYCLFFLHGFKIS
jgi:hypothetical protein